MAIHLAHFGTKKLLIWYISPKLQNRINDHYKHYVPLPNTLPSFFQKSASINSVFCYISPLHPAQESLFSINCIMSIHIVIIGT
jgi:hypothetical protein